MALSPAFELVLAIQGGLGLLVYDDRRTRGLPWLWWPSGVASLGPIVYIIYTYRRPDHLRIRDQPSVLTTWQYVQAGPAYAPPAWYVDPWRQARLRYWDGAQWTAHTSH